MEARKAFFFTPNGTNCGKASASASPSATASSSSSSSCNQLVGSQHKQEASSIARKRSYRIIPFANIDNNAIGALRYSAAGSVGSTKRVRHSFAIHKNNRQVKARTRWSSETIDEVSSSMAAPRTNDAVNFVPSSNTPTPKSSPFTVWRAQDANPETRFVDEVNQGQLKGHLAALTQEGCGGAYILKGENANQLGIWKPRDEEAFAPSNPRGYIDANIRCGSRSPMRPGFRVGWGFLREHAVYKLDQSSALKAGVPLTLSASATPLSQSDKSRPRSHLLSPAAPEARSQMTLAEASSSGKRLSKSPSHPISSPMQMSKSSCSLMHFTKVNSADAIFSGDLGSLQKYVQHIGTMEEFGTLGLSKRQCQIIAALDIRIMNADRHGANLLVTEREVDSEPSPGDSGKRGLIPIDHGYSLPPCLDRGGLSGKSNLGSTTFIWSGYRQCRENILPDVQAFIQGIDQFQDARLLRECGIGSEAILTNRIGTTLLQKGAAAGLTLSEIASLCIRKQASQPSELEIHMLAARSAAHVCQFQNKTSSHSAHHLSHCTFGKSKNTCACCLCQTFNHIDFDALISGTGKLN